MRCNQSAWILEIHSMERFIMILAFRGQAMNDFEASDFFGSHAVGLQLKVPNITCYEELGDISRVIEIK